MDQSKGQTYWKLKPEYVKLSPPERLYQLKVPIVAVTGGLATGKSSVVNFLRKNSAPVICADQQVKEIYKNQDTKRFLQRLIPEALSTNGEVNFSFLREKVFQNTELKNEIENYIYQHLPEAFNSALKNLHKPELIIYDIPLLFEKELHKKVDLSFLVFAPKDAQKKRAILRDQSKEETIEAILNKQLPIERKKSLADIVYDNSSPINLESTQWNKLKKLLLTFLDTNAFS